MKNNCNDSSVNDDFMNQIDINLTKAEWDTILPLIPELSEETYEYGKWEFVAYSFKPCIKNTKTGEIYEY